MVKLNVGTYNVRHLLDVNFEASVIAKDIASEALDIVGLQEIDKGTSRSHRIDEAKLIAGEMGWHYAFCKAVDIDGGEYGHCIISKYPIENFEIRALYSASYEQRVLGCAVININNRKINFLNTHLSLEDEKVRQIQFSEIAEIVKKFDEFILTGDFNTDDYNEFSAIENIILANNFEKKYITFPGEKSGIDNIVVSNNLSMGNVNILTEPHSDHRMLMANVTLH